MLLKVTTKLFLLALLFLSWKPALAQGCNPAGCFTQTALTDITTPYNGFLGGLYGNYSNSPTATQLARLQAAVSSIQPIDTAAHPCTGGTASKPCKILMLTTGMSIGKFEWLATPGYGFGNFTSPQIADVYSVLWRLGEAKEQTPPPANPPYINPYFYAVVGNMNGHYAASWVNDDMNDTWPGNYTHVNVNVINPQWYPLMFHRASVQKYIVDEYGYVEEATNMLMAASGTTEPAWTQHPGDKVKDGSVTWQNDGLQNSITKIIYTFSPAQVQIVHISNFTGDLQFTQSGTVNTMAGSTIITQTGDAPFIMPTTSDGGWNNVPLVLTNGSTHLTCGGKQCIVNTVDSTSQLTTTLAVDPPGGSATYSLGIGFGVAGDPTCDGTWWTQACPNWEYLKWLDAQILRQVRFQYSNIKLIFLGGVDYCGYHDTVTQGRDAVGACLEPYSYETWLTTQQLVMDQTAEMDSVVTLNTCSAINGNEICTTSGLPQQYTTGKYVHVVTSNPALNTPCAPSNCPGLQVTVNGNNLSFTNPGASGTSTSGHVTIVADGIAGSLDSTAGLVGTAAAGTTAPIAISEYTWTPGPVPRGDMFGPMPAEAYACDGIHPSAGSSSGCTEAATCSSQVTVPGGDDPYWMYINNPPWCGQGYLSNQTINFMVDNYHYSRQNWFSSIICAAGHTTPGCM